MTKHHISAFVNVGPARLAVPVTVSFQWSPGDPGCAPSLAYPGDPPSGPEIDFLGYTREDGLRDHSGVEEAVLSWWYSEGEAMADLQCAEDAAYCREPDFDDF